MNPLHPGRSDLVSCEPAGQVTIPRHELSAAELLMMNLVKIKVMLRLSSCELTLWTPPTLLAQYPVRKASSTLTRLMSRLAVNKGITKSPGKSSIRIENDDSLVNIHLISRSRPPP